MPVSRGIDRVDQHVPARERNGSAVARLHLLRPLPLLGQSLVYELELIDEILAFGD